MNGAQKKWNLRRTIAAQAFSVQPTGNVRTKFENFMGFFLNWIHLEWVCLCLRVRKILGVPIGQNKKSYSDWIIISLHFLSQ